MVIRTTSHATDAASSIQKSRGGAFCGHCSGTTVVPLAVVVSVTVVDATLEPSRVAVDGDTAQLAPATATMQLHVTV
jgi:hypothetical protein